MNKEDEMLLFGNRNERLNNILKVMCRTKDDLDDDIKIIKEWLKKQRHFPETPRDEIITNMLILNKFSIEKFKKNIDNYYSLRGVFPELFLNKNQRLPHMKVARDNLYYVGMPNLTKDGLRINIVNLASPDPNAFVPYDLSATSFHYIECRLIKDVMAGEIFIIDLEPYSLAHIGKLTPVVVKKVFTAAEKAYKNIVKQIHFINAPSYVEGLLTLIKQIVSKKLSERIYAHKSFEGLHKYIPLECLPKDYGGTNFTLEELREKWQKVLEVNQNRIDELDMTTNESLRCGPLINDEVLGFYGNFKKLNVD